MQLDENHRWKGCFEGERTIFTKQTADCGNKQKLVSGYGQFHSNESTAKNPQPYVQVTLEDIRCLVDNPQQVDKTQAQWLILSTLQSRIFKKQEENGEYLLLWVDIDKNSPNFDKLVEITNSIIDSHDFEAYTSRSATEQNQKARVLVPLARQLSFIDWHLCQSVFNDLLEAHGITPDRANERAAQLCYLPNRGVYYNSESKREGRFFDPMSEWSDLILQKRNETKTQTEKLKALSKKAKSKLQAFKPSAVARTSTGLIGAFNEAYTVQDILLQSGYEQKGNTFRHPNSESGSFSANVKDGRVHSLSTSDPLNTGGGGIGAHDAFSAFTVLFCDGDRNQALKDAGNNWLAINSESWNKVQQRESYSALLNEVSAINKDTPPDAIQVLVVKTRSLPTLQQSRILETIKKNTGIPLGTLRAALREEAGGSNSSDDLGLARTVIKAIGSDNIIATQGCVWQWNDAGVWQKLEKRAVKQIVQDHIAQEVDVVSKHLVESVSDLFEKAIYKKDHLFNVGEVECVNCLNGELSLLKGNWELRPHTREHYRTSQIPVAYDPEAKAPKFEKFLNEVFAGDADIADKKQALLEMMGYTLTAHCRHEKFIILVGSGANGKSVVLCILEALVGEENIAGVQPSCFDRSFHRAHLHGKLANIVTEIKQGEVIDDASLKSIVSGEPTTVEHKFGDPFVMRPYATCWFGTNHLPHTRDFSDALFRRVLVFTFNQVFKPELGNCDPMLKKSLMCELPGILNLSLQAYATALETTFTTPRSCIDARNDWRVEADQVLQFIEDECVKDPDGKVQAQPLYKAYTEWARESGVHRTVGMRTFRERLTDIGFGSTRDSAGRYVTGLTCDTVSGVIRHL